MNRTWFSLLLVLSLSVFAKSFPQGLWSPYVKNSYSPVKKENFILINPFEDTEDHSKEGEEVGSYEGSGEIGFEDDEDISSGIKPYLPKDWDTNIGFGIIPYTTAVPTTQYKATPRDRVPNIGFGIVPYTTGAPTTQDRNPYIGFGIVPYTTKVPKTHRKVTPQVRKQNDDDYWPNEKKETNEPTDGRASDEGVQVEEKLKPSVPFWEMSFSGHWSNVADVFNSFGSKTTKFFTNFGEDARDLYDKASDSLAEFGLDIRKGSEFLANRMNHEFDRAMGTQIMKKLMAYLHLGNETISKFFQDIGTKVQKWRQGRNHEGVDDSFYDSLNNEQEGDVFQDPEIRQELNDLVGRNILTDEEALAITQPEIAEVNEIDFRRNKF